MTRTLLMTRSQVSADGGGLQVQPVAGGLAESGEELVAGLLGVGLDPDDQPGVAEPDPVAGAGAVDGGVRVAVCRACAIGGRSPPSVCR